MVLDQKRGKICEVLCGAVGKKRKSAGADPTAWQDRLVDVLLSLSAYSSAQLPSLPLREAVEATFRAFASDITQTGLSPSFQSVARCLHNCQLQPTIISTLANFYTALLLRRRSCGKTLLLRATSVFADIFQTALKDCCARKIFLISGRFSSCQPPLVQSGNT